jgi:GNAT superfamily N-acetyltransferase
MPLPFRTADRYEQIMDVRIEALSLHRELVPLVARWHFDEWGHTDPGGSAEGWAAGLASQADADQVPGTVIALSGDRPVGVVCLVAQDMPGYGPAAGLTPWIKGLYVPGPARRQGVGALLVRRCQAWAAALGHADLYLYTERGSAAQALYEGLGWQVIGLADYDGLAVTVMRTTIKPAADVGS